MYEIYVAVQTYKVTFQDNVKL